MTSVPADRNSGEPRPLPCIVCTGVTDRAHSSEWGDKGPVLPHKATQFHTYGHYGSTLFDPLRNDEALYVNICDECLARRASQGFVQHVMFGPEKPRDVTVEPFGYQDGEVS